MTALLDSHSDSDTGELFNQLGRMLGKMICMLPGVSWGIYEETGIRLMHFAIQ